MILMTHEDVEDLFFRFHGPRDPSLCATTCRKFCNPTVHSVCGLLRRARPTKIATEHLSEAARRWKPFTDSVCDTSKCLSCPDYSWCHQLREIYDEGVLCYDSSNH